jgi:hypothetical protein
MKQYYITRENILQDSPNDCYLAPTDPIHELKIASSMGGLGSAQKLAEYRARVAEDIKLNTADSAGMTGNDKAQYMKANNIRPGTPAWFELWYGNKK